MLYSVIIYNCMDYEIISCHCTIIKIGQTYRFKQIGWVEENEFLSPYC